MRRLAVVLLLVPPGLLALLLLGDRRADMVAGEVRDNAGPVDGATVRLKGRADSTLSDVTGRFRLPRDRSARRVTAWMPGHLITGSRLDASPLLLSLVPLPKDDNPEYDWVDPAPNPSGEHHCGNCHQEMFREWSGSGHARSATGRRFRDLYSGTGGGWGLLTRHPDGAGVCAACHAPTIRAGDPALHDISKVRGVDAKGVHCDYCHKVTGATGDEIGLAHGRDTLTLLRPREGQLFFGPLDDVDRGEDSYSPFYHDSRYCAACHEGVIFGVHVYSTYSEWLDSPARQQGRQCQDCHMKPTGKMTNLAPGHGGIERDPRTLANHRFFDGSHEQMLRQCLQLSAEARREQEGVRLEVRLRVEGAGHRVPTGFIDRHLILTVDTEDERGSRLDATGPHLPDAAGVELKDRPGLLFAKLLTDRRGRGPLPFWDAAAEEHDNRLRPGQEERTTFRLPSSARRVTVRVIYRKFWQEVARTKGWPDDDLVVAERRLRLP